MDVSWLAAMRSKRGRRTLLDNLSGEMFQNDLRRNLQAAAYGLCAGGVERFPGLRHLDLLEAVDHENGDTFTSELV